MLVSKHTVAEWMDFAGALAQGGANPAASTPETPISEVLLSVSACFGTCVVATDKSYNYTSVPCIGDAPGRMNSGCCCLGGTWLSHLAANVRHDLSVEHMPRSSGPFKSK
jgi:hypothetical protein